MARSRSREARKAAAAGAQLPNELDLNDPEVKKWHKSKKQRAHEKSELRKERERKGREAATRIAGQRGLIEQHREAKDQEMKAAASERNQRKRKLQGERNEARRKRAVMANAQARSVTDYQAYLQQQNVEKQATEGQKMRQHEDVIRQRILEEERAYEARKAMGLGEEVVANTQVVHVDRTPELEYSRRLLPILNVEQEIVEAINDLTANALMLCGETGSGKTTQIPQFLWEAGYSSKDHPTHRGMIGVTQPRRVAARSIAKRVAEELNTPFGGEVGYQVRYDNNVGVDTRIKFMTEGILLKEIQSDIALRQYSVIIIDEAHERSVATDLLLGLLTRIVRLRWEESHFRKKGSPLKLVIMSATLQVSTLSENKVLFPIPPKIINVEARQFPVTKHFARRTQPHKFVEEAVHKITQVHTKLPPGGLLVFLPTQRTIEQVVKKVKDVFSQKRVKYSVAEWDAKKEGYIARKDKALNETEDRDAAKIDEFGLTIDDYDLPDMLDGDTSSTAKGPRDDFLEVGGMEIDADDDAAQDLRPRSNAPQEAVEGECDDEEMEEEEGEEGEEEEEEEAQEGAGVEAGGEVSDEEAQPAVAEAAAAAEEGKKKKGKKGRLEDGVELEEAGELDTVHVLPLFSLLNPKLQNRVFEEVPKGKRLIVVATNIAETSLTIPGIRYVVDSGREKTRVYNAETGVAKYEVKWVSKASAEQRAGRAGRVGAGHVYRLFSTAVFANECPDHNPPEILTSPLDSIVLFIKGFWRDVSVLAFPFPDAPPAGAVRYSLQHLARIGALTEKTDRYDMSTLGEALSHFPVLPRYGKMLVLARVLMESGPTLERARWLRGIIPMSNAVTVKEVGQTVRKLVGAKEVKSLFSTVMNIVCIAASMMDVFVPPPNDQKELREKFKESRNKFRSASSDYLTALNVLIAFLKLKPSQRQVWCENHFLSFKNLKDALDLRKQLSQLLLSEEGSLDVYASVADEEEVTQDSHAAKKALSEALEAMPSKELPLEARIIVMKLVASGLIDNVARLATAEDCEARGVRLESGRKSAYVQVLTKDILYMHPTSTVGASEWVVYTSLQKGDGSKSKTTMRGVTVVRRDWLEALGWAGV